MNICLLFLIIIYLWWHLALQSKGLAPHFWQALRSALQRRDFLLDQLPVNNPLENKIRETLRQAIRQGRMPESGLDDLEKTFGSSERLFLKSQRLYRLYLVHIALALSLALGFRLLLTRTLWMHAGDWPSILGCALPLLFSALIMYVCWPRLWSLDHMQAFAFVSARLTSSSEGPWQAQLNSIEETAWREGSNPEPARRQTLMTWALQREHQFESRLAMVEEALGPSELAFSVLLIAILDAWPLLERLSEINAS
jgi:hypothetical protein